MHMYTIDNIQGQGIGNGRDVIYVFSSYSSQRVGDYFFVYIIYAYTDTMLIYGSSGNSYAVKALNTLQV